MKKRLLGVLIVLVMVIGLMPVAAFAEEANIKSSAEENEKSTPEEKEEDGEETESPCYWVNAVTVKETEITPGGYWTELGLNEGEVLTVRFCYGTKTENETVIPKSKPVFQPKEGTNEDAVTITREKIEGIYEIEAVSIGSGTIEVSFEEVSVHFSVVVEEAEDEGEKDDDKENGEEDDKDKEDDDEKDEIIHSPQIPGENTAFFDYEGETYVIGFTGEEATHYVDGTEGNYTQDHLENDAYGKQEQRSYIGISEVGESQELEDLREVPEMYQLIEDIEIYTAVYDEEGKELVPIDEDDLLYSPSYDFRSLKTDETGQYYVPFYRLFVDGYHYLVGEVTLEGVEETLQFCFYFKSTYVNSKEIDLSDKEYEDLNDLDELNDFIADDVQEDSKTYRYDIIFDPKVTYKGTLKLQGDKKIVIDGNGATLQGNVTVERPEEESDDNISRYHEIHDLHMVSTAEDMVGISGDGNVFAETVNFVGYACAVKTYDAGDTAMQKTTAYNCWFIDNGVGIYWDGKNEVKREGNSNYDIARCRFEGNGVGIRVVNHKEIDDTEHLIYIENCEFVDNKTDISNTSKYTYWAEGCFFGTEDENSDQEVSRPAKTEKIIVSYIYAEPILEYQELPEDDKNNKSVNGNKNQFIDRFIGEIPVAPENDFSYNNANPIPSIEMVEFDKKIEVLGEYDLEEDEHELIGIWDFGKEDAE